MGMEENQRASSTEDSVMPGAQLTVKQAFICCINEDTQEYTLRD
jgi:hypothetical protein